jgi:hypothetical protein
LFLVISGWLIDWWRRDQEKSKSKVKK